MFGIETVATYIPEGRMSNMDVIEKFNITEEFLDNKTGSRVLPIKTDSEDTSDLAVEAVKKLLQKTNLDLQKIEGLILCTQNPDGHGLPHTSAIVHGKLGLSSKCAAFDVSLGCSGYVYGISIAIAFAQANNLNNVVFITSDPYSKVVSPDDKNTRLLFGDAATATLLSRGQKRIIIKKALFATEGKSGDALKVREDRQLEMNGRAVFNFSATSVPSQINELLSEVKMSIEDIDYFLFHQGSKYILDTLKKRLCLPDEQVVTTISFTGNTVSSSIPILLNEVFEKNLVANRILMSGFGVGLSYASAILEWKSDD